MLLAAAAVLQGWGFQRWCIDRATGRHPRKETEPPSDLSTAAVCSRDQSRGTMGLVNLAGCVVSLQLPAKWPHITAGSPVRPRSAVRHFVAGAGEGSHTPPWGAKSPPLTPAAATNRAVGRCRSNPCSENLNADRFRPLLALTDRQPDRFPVGKGL